MYIKQVIIEGFKSYKEQVATEPFSPKHNCVVGANGSGKTNFFHAIRFVLSDLFHNLRAEDRQALLHEGAGHQVLSAFVEIVFDNSDNRIPVDKEEVRLRRTIGMKKDEYFLDKKHITKTEVMNLLESAGFSRSNPYYVVQQGKIASLTLMKDSERLDLLKEIGGTRVYEERRKESLKIMQDTENRRKQIIDVVQYIEERLKELDEEKEELKKYQQLDKQRRSLEYTIFEKELLDARQKLEEIEEARARVSEKSSNMHNAVVESHERLKGIEKELKTLAKGQQGLLKEKESAEKQKTEAMKALAKFELDVRDVEDRIKSEARTKEEVTKELQSLEKEIKKTENEFEQVKPVYDRQVAEEDEITKGIIEREKRLSVLYQKQGRATQFGSKRERDKWLQKEASDLEKVVETTSAQIVKLEEEIRHMNEELEAHTKSIQDRSRELADEEALVAKCMDDIAALKVQRDEHQETRKKLWKTESILSNEVDKLKFDIVKAEKALDHSAPGDIRRGLNSVRRICRDHNISGVHGPLFELLDCDDKFFTAVEVTAGNSLYHVVVDTDDISTRIIRYLSAEKGGRVTFIPLNRVRAPRVTYPTSSDVVPLLKKLRFDPKFSEAFGQVFGRTIICRDLDVATNFARSADLDCITMEGDQVSKKGGMTGGFYDHRRSKLKYMTIVKENARAIHLKEQELEKVRNSFQDIDQKINQVVTELQKLEPTRAHHKSLAEQLKSDISNLKKQETSLVHAIEKKKKSLAVAHQHIEQVRSSILTKRTEMGTDLIDQLTPDEKTELSRLNPEISDLKDMLVRYRAARMETETRMSELETLLSTNLVRRQQELEAQFSAIDPDSMLADLEQKKQASVDASTAVEEATRNLKVITDNIEKHAKQVRDLKNAKDELKALEDNYERTLQDEAKDLEQLLNRKNLLQVKREDLTKKIRDLGSLPSDAFEKYQRKSLKELHKMFHKCNEELKKFSHVNKKALDQYVNFTEQREELHKRQAELDNGDEKIRELISVLDQRKDEAIERTFKGVAKNFREAFAELVQGGHGSLVMMKKRKADEAEDEDADNDEDGNREAGSEGRVEKYVGVKVKVSFTGQGETQSMKQLSGGQKTVVALALIFAIQRCDPGPFYLFDEIDAALDPQYRTAVGNMIKRQADTANTQFITTTFRSELVKVADRIYGVTHKNRVSRVDVISKDDALQFIEQDQTHHNE
ncbi:structural maintenance of chromosomes protein 3-like [Selaginella moellendorffii]|uniref:structural maintenance of chromosomes protein 3-like n=1 Tax=Selaginella moellendorffii TaxID=88036 RepID=UPI000D1C45E6|nr:structural maintenance of chromosomes protein 3-like [Selaginella moellendorffii]|eukprot:XP_024525303.1 structural maintenance of chromosomes protein 3-like [Selaginella moellendorffii]